MTPRDTVWPLDDHTRGKHAVLREYLNAWLPILGRTNGRVVFIDGFAGPGEYTGGEMGSPLIAMDAFHTHVARERMRDVRFLFIEERPDRADHLRGLLERQYLPSGEQRWAVECGECAPTINRLLDDLDVDGDKLAPSLVMLDPFGPRGIPMSLVRRVMGYRATEVYT
jgi:three-Cys-motif partner protein